MNQEIRQKIDIIVKKIEDLKSKSINEAQTKEWLIKPFFSVLGWDFSNPNEVIPEDDDMAGKRTDYSFYVNHKTQLLIESKPLSNNLDDNKMIMEKLNYCANSGTQLLIITNGDLYRIYFSDLKGIGREKLLREFCLSDNIDDEIIDMLSRQAFENDSSLLNYAKNISILTSIKNVIEKLFSESNKTIINLINNELKNKIGFKFHDDEIRKALKSISLEININANENEVIIKKQSADKLAIDENNKINGQSQKTDINYRIEDHFKGGKWVDSLSLYNQFIKYIQDNQLKFNITPMKHYINLSKNDKSFCQINSQQNGLKIFINLVINDLSEHEVLKTRDVSKIGHLGIGNIEFKLNNFSDFELAFGLLKKSYNKLN